MFSCEYCEILKKTYFQGHLGTTTFLYVAVAPDSEAYDFTGLYYDPNNLNSVILVIILTMVTRNQLKNGIIGISV